MWGGLFAASNICSWIGSVLSGFLNPESLASSAVRGIISVDSTTSPVVVSTNGSLSTTRLFCVMACHLPGGQPAHLSYPNVEQCAFLAPESAFRAHVEPHFRAVQGQFPVQSDDDFAPHLSPLSLENLED